MIYVVDASAVIDLLVRSDPGERVRRRLSDDADAALVTVAQLDAELFSGLARLHRAGELTVAEVVCVGWQAWTCVASPSTARCCRQHGECATTSPPGMRCRSRLPVVLAVRC